VRESNHIINHLSIFESILGKRQTAQSLADKYGRPDLVQHLRRFLYNQLHNDSSSSSSSSTESTDVPLASLPDFQGKIRVHPSAVATFYAPSDLSGVGGMRREWIRAVPQWRGGPGRYDCVFTETNTLLKGMRGLDIARIRLLLSFEYENTPYPCALVRWYSRLDDEPDEATGMWAVVPDYNDDGTPYEAIIHLDCILRAAHLIGAYGEDFVLPTMTLHKSLDRFESFYVNKYIDHHAFEIAF
jgi:hypothetical protein